MRLSHTKNLLFWIHIFVIFWQTKKLFVYHSRQHQEKNFKTKKLCGWYCNGRWRHLMNSIILINVDKYSFLLVQFLALLCLSALLGDEPKQIFGKTSLFMLRQKKMFIFEEWQEWEGDEEEGIQMFVLILSWEWKKYWKMIS